MIAAAAACLLLGGLNFLICRLTGFLTTTTTHCCTASACCNFHLPTQALFPSPTPHPTHAPPSFPSPPLSYLPPYHTCLLRLCTACLYVALHCSHYLFPHHTPPPPLAPPLLYPFTPPTLSPSPAHHCHPFLPPPHNCICPHLLPALTLCLFVLALLVPTHAFTTWALLTHLTCTPHTLPTLFLFASPCFLSHHCLAHLQLVVHTHHLSCMHITLQGPSLPHTPAHTSLSCSHTLLLPACTFYTPPRFGFVW